MSTGKWSKATRARRRIAVRKLEKLIGDEHLTSDEAAELLGCHRTTVGDWIRGRCLPSLSAERKILALVGDDIPDPAEPSNSDPPVHKGEGGLAARAGVVEAQLVVAQAQVTELNDLVAGMVANVDLLLSEVFGS